MVKLINNMGGKPLFDVTKIEAGIKAAQQKTANGIKKDMEAVTATWDHPVRVEVKIVSGATDVIVDDDIFTMLDEGTRPHVIRPKRAKRLAFGVPSIAKTSPGVLVSRAGGGGKTRVFARAVQHPGTKPRKWIITSLDKWEPKFQQMMAEVFK